MFEFIQAVILFIVGVITVVAMKTIIDLIADKGQAVRAAREQGMSLSKWIKGDRRLPK